MGRYDNEDNYVGNASLNRQRDIVLSVNEFVFIQSKTNGAIKTYTGPTTATISAQESLVTFNNKTKRFEETTDFEKARQLFTSAPEGWYVVLKNPSADGSYPDAAKAVNSPELKIGRKVNIAGPCSFSLYPGQMAKTIRGHRLRSNQYLLARVYDADAASANVAEATVINAEGKEIKQKAEKYFVGQLLVIKGTEISFYMPPTGIEVIPVDGVGNTYVRDAITLERLEYAILKDEDGEKRYVHGPAVVFPKPTETFVETPNGGNIFRALELSPISGIYVKVIAEYKDENEVVHPIGEELFITGNDQMIYYPRPEHAMIQYDGKYMHHAIAIPEGEGRYILNRLTGEITTVKGPKMYLPDPRTEVVVKRKLTPKECNLIYPNNLEVLAYNQDLTEKAIEKSARLGKTNAVTDMINNAYSTSNQESTLAIFEANANISRGVSYTKPRTITLDTKYDGVVAVEVWSGYAINVVSKNGSRETVVGPATRLLNYDETLESVKLSTGRPKNDNNIIETAYLKIKNNRITDAISVQTKDGADALVEVSYCVDFLDAYKDNWFAIENYVKYLCDNIRVLLRKEAKKFNIEEFYSKANEIIRDAILIKNKDGNKLNSVFVDCGMEIKDVEVLRIKIETEVANMLEKSQKEIIRKTLELSNATRKMETVTQLAEYEKKEQQLAYDNKIKALELDKTYEVQRLLVQKQLDEERRAMAKASEQATLDLQEIVNAVHEADLERKKKSMDLEIEKQKAEAAIEEAKQKAYADTVQSIMLSIQPDLVAALSTKANADLFVEAAKNIGPYAIAGNESISDTINKLMRGTPIEGILDKALADKVNG